VRPTTVILLAMSLGTLGANELPQPTTATNAPSKFRSEDDGWLDDNQSTAAGGAGFPYELARRYGVHAGLDVAFGPDDPAVYVQVGSAWMRP
jgi:hypothetical protein